MHMLPEDIAQRITRDYPELIDRATVTGEIEQLWTASLNVGPVQLARSILYLAEGDGAKLAELCRNLMGDPRDVIMAAERKAGDPGHYFIHPFND